MGTLIEIITIFFIFFVVSHEAYYFIEVKGMPSWLNYRPFSCRLCFTFWTLITIYTTFLLSFQCLYLGIGGIILAILNAIAMKIDQKNRTVKIEDMDE